MNESINRNEEQVCAINDFKAIAFLSNNDNNSNHENIDMPVIFLEINSFYGMLDETAEGNYTHIIGAEIKKGEIFYKPKIYEDYNNYRWHTFMNSYVILKNNDPKYLLFLIPKDKFNKNFITKKNLSSIYGICNNPN